MWSIGFSMFVHFEIISHLLAYTFQVLPARPSISRASSFSSDCSSSSTSSSTTGFSCNSSLSNTSTTLGSTTSNLLDQLITSPETRFHAAYMFLRYFYLVRGESGSPLRVTQGNGAGRVLPSEDGFELVTWDIAVGCLALSVKVR
jgi:hypothetical protein